MVKAADFRQRARETLEGKWGAAVLVCFLGVLLGGIMTQNVVTVNYDNTVGWQLQVANNFKFDLDFLTWNPVFAGALASIIGMVTILGIAQFIIGGTVELGLCKYFIKVACRQDADVSDEFSYFNYLFKAFGLRFMMTLFTVLWTLLLIIPGIIAAYRYSLAPYIMAENPEIGIMEAIDISKDLMDGNKWRSFCLDLSFIGWSILCVLTLGIGYLFLNPYMQAASAHFYLTIRDSKNNDRQETFS